MKNPTRSFALAFAALAVAGVLGAQPRVAPRRGASHAAPRGQSSRGHMESRPRQDVRVQRYAAGRADFGGRADVRGRAGSQGRTDVRVQRYAAGRSDYAVRGDVRARVAYRAPVAAFSRPLITRAYAGPRAVYGGSPAYRGVGRFSVRAGLPFGWERRVVFHGYFPADYASYCEAVPLEYDYLLPPMGPYDDPCLFGDRVIVVDRFSRSIVFIATL
jgi:hypothetical protein